MTRFLTLWMLLLPATLAAQRVPDDQAILAAVIDRASPYYYPGLMERYERGDTTLTLDEYHYLYYGYAFQDEYKPRDPVPGVDEQVSIMGLTDRPDSAQLRTLIRASQQVMEHDPFSPANLNYLTYAYGRLGDTIAERIHFDRFRKVLETITSSGTGTREDSPWHVLMFSHASDLMGAMGLDFVKRQVRSSRVEYIQLAVRDKEGNRGYYFDFGRIYTRLPEKEPEHQPRTWKINNYPVGKKKR